MEFARWIINRCRHIKVGFARHASASRTLIQNESSITECEQERLEIEVSANRRVMGISWNISGLRHDGSAPLLSSFSSQAKIARPKQSIICCQPLIQNMNELIMLI